MSLPSPELEQQFGIAMLEIYKRALRDVNYRATFFFQMLTDRGGLETARSLINASRPADGYTALWGLGRLDLTVEALIFDHSEWHPLFTDDERKRVHDRLREYGYPPAVITSG